MSLMGVAMHAPANGGVCNSGLALHPTQYLKKSHFKIEIRVKTIEMEELGYLLMVFVFV